jgi:pimeloyl-ACP methyl ester carboxylesterase
MLSCRFVAPLSVGLFVFASPNYAQTVTTSNTDAAVVTAAPATRQAADDLGHPLGVISSAAQKTAEMSLPVAIGWARRAYRNLIYFHEVDRGGHVAAWEQPELFTAELRAAFKSLR